MADEGNGVPATVPEIIKLVTMSLGLSYFIYLILTDTWAAFWGKPRTHWIRGKALILSALSIQVLSYLDYRNIRFSDEPTYRDVAKLLGNQLVIDSGRVVICVFIGYLLPGMANRGSAEASSDIVALVVSLFTAIVSELYYVRKAGNILSRVDYDYAYDFLINYNNKPTVKLWFIVSSVIFLTAIVCLILFLVSAIIAGKTVRCMLKQRISSVIKQSRQKNESKTMNEIEGEVLKSWLVCRAGQPEYVIARSVLISSTGLVVTACVVLLVAKALYLRSFNFLHYDDGLDCLRHITFVLQCVFVLLGWFVIFYRWLMAVLYFPKFFTKGLNCSLCQRPTQCRSRFGVEDFWKRSIFELVDMYSIQKCRRKLKPKAEGICNGLSVKVLTTLRLHWLLYSLLVLQFLIVWFSKCCWVFSEMVFGCKFIRRAVLGNDRWLFYDVDPSKDFQAFKKYEETLEHVCMPGENSANLWLANKVSFDQAEKRMRQGHEDGKECKELISLINECHGEESFVDRLECFSLPLVKEYFPTLKESWWKMTAVSLLKIIIRLEVDGSKKDEAIKAYKQAWDLMSFIESSNTKQPNSIDVTQDFDIEADLVSMAADKELEELDKMQDSSQVLTVGDATEIIEELLKEAEEHLREENLKEEKLLEGQETHQDVEKSYVPICHELRDSKDWNIIAPCYSMYRVCKDLNSQSHSNLNALVDYLHRSLGDVIVQSLKQLSDVLERSLIEWAIEYETDSIWEAIYIAGKNSRISQECPLLNHPKE
ncbi:hypothetical protein SUGI_0042710 [Cryptomeria japonica]|nr:hypothetical protein SUGI_0042710 [Cryptomeria japonica]